MKRVRDSKCVTEAKCHGCGKGFKTRGLKRHQKFCNDLEVLDYKFFIVEKHVFRNILSFLSNQTIVKLQSITGDRYPQCDRELAVYCCACENDNPVIVDGVCYECARDRDDYKPRITKTEAKNQYGIDVAGIPCEERRRYTLYKRVDLEKRVFQVFGSRLEWAKSIAQRNSRVKKLAASKRKKLDDYNAYLATLSPAFVQYIKNIGATVPRDQLGICCERFTALSSALAQSKLSLRKDSRLCKLYITAGSGVVDEIVDMMEEMKFLYAHTKYSSRCKARIESFREFDDELYPRDEYNDILQSCREDAKMELCIEYLEDDKGLALPRKWEKCCERYRDVVVANTDTKKRIWYIYTGKGRKPMRAPSPS